MKDGAKNQNQVKEEALGGGCLVVTYLRECDNDDHVDLYPWNIESWIGWMLLVR